MGQAFDLKIAKTNPSKFFKTPEEVVDYPNLTREDRIAILHQWETDARLLSVAEDENMTDGERSQLGAVTRALIALDDKAKRPGHPEKSGPSKLGA